MSETWAPTRFAGYDVSSEGRVRSTGRVLSPSLNSKGYLYVSPSVGGVKNFCPVHRLVAEAFLDGKGELVRHLDGNQINNHVDNLAYGDTSSNGLDSVRHGTHANARKTHCPHGHAYSPENTYLSPSGGRKCRACNRAAVARCKARKRLAYVTQVDQ